MSAGASAEDEAVGSLYPQDSSVHRRKRKLKKPLCGRCWMLAVPSVCQWVSCSWPPQSLLTQCSCQSQSLWGPSQSLHCTVQPGSYSPAVKRLHFLTENVEQGIKPCSDTWDRINLRMYNVYYTKEKWPLQEQKSIFIILSSFIPNWPPTCLSLEQDNSTLSILK